MNIPFPFHPVHLSICLLTLVTACSKSGTPGPSAADSASNSLEIPAPPVVQGALVTIAIPDLRQTLDVTQNLVDRVLPEGSRLDIKLGGRLNDPEWTGFPTGGGAAWVWDGKDGYGFIECTPETADHVQHVFTGMQLQTSVEEDRLLFSRSRRGLDKAAQEQGRLSAALLNQETAGMFFTVQVADVVKQFLPQINMGIGMMPMLMAQGAAQMPQQDASNMQSMARIVEGELLVLVSLASQVETMGVRVIPGEDALEVDYTIVAGENTNLERLLAAPATVEPDPRVTVAHLTEATIEMEMFLGNPEALLTFFKAETEQLVEQMSLSPDTTAAIERMVEIWPGFFTGSMAQTLGMDPKTGISMEYILTVSNEGEFRRMLESLPNLMEPFTGLYAEMGMPIEVGLNLNARRIREIPIHQYQFRYILEDMEPAAADSMRRTGMSEMDSELALVDGLVLWSMGDMPLENLIDRFTSGQTGKNTLEAHRVYPEGGNLYLDVHLADYFGYIAAFMPPELPENPLIRLQENLRQAPPFTGALFQQNNRVRMSYTLPAEILEAFVQLSKAEPR